nr:Hsp20 family protein [Comamonas testosteroni]
MADPLLLHIGTAWGEQVSFQRALNLPDDANQDSIKANFKNGVLTITMDKREVSAPKQGRSIPVNN